MVTYIATFFSHFGAIRFHKQLKEQKVQATMMPVPRKVSSSCGTCVRFQGELDAPPRSSDIESLFMMESDDKLTQIYSNL